MKKDTEKFKLVISKHYPAANKKFSNLRGEKWAAIPGFEETHEVSKYGRIKRLARVIEIIGRKPMHIKEQVLCHYIAKSPNNHVKDFTYHLIIGLKKKKKKTTFSIRRLVYHCFVEHLDDVHGKDYCIIPKDGNGYNVYYKNLLKLSLAQQGKRIYKDGRNVSHLALLDHKMIIEKGLPKRLKSVSQYGSDGYKIGFFPSIKAAAEATGLSASLISNVANGRRFMTGKYFWRYGDEPMFIDIKAYGLSRKKAGFTKKNRPVTQYNSNGERVAIHPSFNCAAEAVNAAPCAISRAASNNFFVKGFLWRKGNGKERIDVSGKLSWAMNIERQKKAVSQFTRDGRYLRTFNSIAEAAVATGLFAQSISANASGQQKYVGEFVWQFSQSKKTKGEPLHATMFETDHKR